MVENGKSFEKEVGGLNTQMGRSLNTRIINKVSVIRLEHRATEKSECRLGRHNLSMAASLKNNELSRQHNEVSYKTEYPLYLSL